MKPVFMPCLLGFLLLSCEGKREAVVPVVDPNVEKVKLVREWDEQHRQAMERATQGTVPTPKPSKFASGATFAAKESASTPSDPTRVDAALVENKKQLAEAQAELEAVRHKQREAAEAKMRQVNRDANAEAKRLQAERLKKAAGSKQH